MRRILLPFLVIAISLLRSSGAYGQSILSADGPYILDNSDNTSRVISVGVDGTVSDKIVPRVRIGDTFQVVSHDGQFTFDVTIHDILKPDWKYGSPARTFVMSDPHAKMDCFVSLLQGNGVIDKDLHWSYGSNHLAVLGDIFDRGADATQIFWLVYQLEYEASLAGGRVSFIYGNHEPMVLTGDLRYTDEKYQALADVVGMDYPQLLGPQTELGKWLVSRNTLMMIGDNLFVHAGLGEDFLERDLSIEEINYLMNQGLYLSRDSREELNPLLDFLFRTYGPIWYRGLVSDSEKNKPASEQTLDKILRKYGAKRLFVGHTIFDEVSTFYGGKVVDVNVDNRPNMEEGRTRGLVIRRGRKYRLVTDSGMTGKWTR